MWVDSKLRTRAVAWAQNTNLFKIIHLLQKKSHNNAFSNQKFSHRSFM